MTDENDDSFRSFGGINDEEVIRKTLLRAIEDPDKKRSIVESLRSSIIGSYEKFSGPFGNRPIIYADWTASGKCVRKVEDFISNNVIPLYGNTHTTTSITGHQTTCFRHEARQIVAEAVNAKVTGRAAVDVVIFTGNGTTAAINKLILSIGLNIPLPAGYDESHRPIVFTSSYEHHSNLLSWRESVADVITVQYHPSTGVCLTDLSRLLSLHTNRKVKIGAFSAASNVTGVLTAADAVSALLHRAGGMVLFDYATAAPYVKIDMNPLSIGDDAPYVYKDAIIFSGHKFIGGPGCPGVLVVKRAVLPAQNSLPTEPGGGTVFYVTEEHHRYLSNREEREEGGTPDILGDVKLGLVVSLKQSFGAGWIEQEELRISRYAQSRLTANRWITLLGRTGGWIGAEGEAGMHHLPIFSFLIQRGTRFLHHNFVCALLNDLFGVQSRGGCQCAGPFSQHILGISPPDNKRIELALLDKHEVLRPGFSRFSLSYWMSQEEIDYILDAVNFIADHGWEFLSLYRYNHKTGEWAHTTRLTRFPERKWLSNFDITSNTAPSSSESEQEQDQAPCTAEGPHRGAGGASSGGSEVARALAVWAVPSPSALMKDMCILAKAELQKVQSARIKRKGGKPSGNGDVSLTAFEDVRWFVMACDPEISLEGGDIEETKKTQAVIKGPVQPPSQPNYMDTAPVPPTMDAHEHIEQLNRLVASLRSQLEGRSAVPSSSSSSAPSINSISAVSVDAMGHSAVVSGAVGSDLGSLYAQQRSQKLCLRAGGEGRQLPRYLEIHRDTSSTSIPPLPGGRTTSDKPAISSAPASRKAVVQESGGSVAPVSSSTIPSKQSPLSSMEAIKMLASIPSQPLATFSSSSASLASSSSNGVKAMSGAGVTYIPTASNSQGTAQESVTVKAIVPPKKIMKLVGQAVKEWGMIEEGDRLLLGLSGGKDSLALLHILLALQKRAPIKFTIACATVDPQTDSFDPSPLIPYVQALGVPYHYLSEPIVALAKTKLQGDSLCAFCSRFKRGLLYSCCRTNGYNKLVLAQHLDDLVESFLMSALHNGQVRTMKANYTIEAGDVRVIRPLVYVRERSTRDFSQEVRLPVINENCPACFEEPKERDRMKKLLAQEEVMIPALFYNLKRALLPLLDDSTYVTMQAVSAAAESRGRSGKDRLPSKKQDQDKKNDGNKRKRSAEGASEGTGPGLFGQNSNLTNGYPVSDSPMVDIEGAAGCSEDMVEESDVTRHKKVQKVMVFGDDGDDSDSEEPPESNVCTSAYCPPCYELA